MTGQRRLQPSDLRSLLRHANPRALKLRRLVVLALADVGGADQRVAKAQSTNWSIFGEAPSLLGAVVYPQCQSQLHMTPKTPQARARPSYSHPQINRQSHGLLPLSYSLLPRYPLIQPSASKPRPRDLRLGIASSPRTAAMQVHHLPHLQALRPPARVRNLCFSTHPPPPPRSFPPHLPSIPAAPVWPSQHQTPAHSARPDVRPYQTWSCAMRRWARTLPPVPPLLGNLAPRAPQYLLRRSLDPQRRTSRPPLSVSVAPLV